MINAEKLSRVRGESDEECYFKRQRVTEDLLEDVTFGQRPG